MVVSRRRLLPSSCDQRFDTAMMPFLLSSKTRLGGCIFKGPTKTVPQGTPRTPGCPSLMLYTTPSTCVVKIKRSRLVSSVKTLDHTLLPNSCSRNRRKGREENNKSDTLTNVPVLWTSRKPVGC